MASSQNKCFVRYESGAGYGIGNAPVNAAAMRDAFAENVCHLADEMTQPRVQWSAKTSQYIASGEVTGALTKIGSWGPFPITVRPDGSSAWLVVRISGLVTTGTQSLYAVLGSGVRADWAEASFRAGDNVQSYTMTNTTNAWLTPTTGEQYLFVPAELMPILLTPIASPGATSGADVSTVNFYMATLTLACVQDGASRVQIHAVSAREYIGT